MTKQDNVTIASLNSIYYLGDVMSMGKKRKDNSVKYAKARKKAKAAKKARKANRK